MLMAGKAIVTGGCGFIGSHLTEFLIKKGLKVTVIDNLSTGNLNNLKDVRGNIEFINSDISDYNSIEKYFDNVSFVFHCAALADIVPSIEKPLEYHNSNVTGTINVVMACQNNNIQKFVYAASSSCYGIPENYPTSEDSDIIPQYPYAVTKFLGEYYVLNLGKIYKLPVISLRFFNVFGPRSRTTGTYGAVFGIFLKQILEKKPLTIVGNGEQSRDFIFVSDVVNALWSAAISDIKNEVFNVGSGISHSINYLTKLLSAQSKIYIPKRPGEPDKTLADITKIKKYLGWQPIVSFEKGVEIVLENINYWKNAPLWDESSITKATLKWFQLLK